MAACQGMPYLVSLRRGKGLDPPLDADKQNHHKQKYQFCQNLAGADGEKCDDDPPHKNDIFPVPPLLFEPAAELKRKRLFVRSLFRSQFAGKNKDAAKHQNDGRQSNHRDDPRGLSPEATWCSMLEDV